MLAFVKMHTDYLITKVFILVVGLIMLIIFLSSIYASQVYEGYYYIDAFRFEFGLDFYNEVYTVMEVSLVFISIFIGMNLSNRSNKALMLYTVHSRESKKQFVLSRLLTGIFIIILIWLINIIFLIAYTKTFTPYVYPKTEVYLQSLYLLIEILDYYLITLVIVSLSNQILVGLIPLITFWLLEIFGQNDKNKIIKFMSKVIMNIKGYQFIEKNLVTLLIALHFVTISYIILMIKKDC